MSVVPQSYDSEPSSVQCVERPPPPGEEEHPAEPGKDHDAPSQQIGNDRRESEVVDYRQDQSRPKGHLISKGFEKSRRQFLRWTSTGRDCIRFAPHVGVLGVAVMPKLPFLHSGKALAMGKPRRNDAQGTSGTQASIGLRIRATGFRRDPAVASLPRPSSGHDASDEDEERTEPEEDWGHDLERRFDVGRSEERVALPPEGVDGAAAHFGDEPRDGQDHPADDHEESRDDTRHVQGPRLGRWRGQRWLILREPRKHVRNGGIVR